MTEQVTEQLRRLAGTLTDLQGRVRRGCGRRSRAGSRGGGRRSTRRRTRRAARGRAEVGRTTGPVRSVHEARAGKDDPTGWDDPESPGWDPNYARLRRPVASDDNNNVPPADSVGPAALAVAVAAGRWWLARRGSPWQAAGAGLAAGATLLAGGPMARTALAVLLAVHRLLAATDALGDGAKALDRA